MRKYVRSEDRACEGEKGRVKWFGIGADFDVFAICHEGDLLTNHSVVAVGRGKCRVVLNKLF